MFEEIFTFEGDYIMPLLEGLSYSLSEGDITNDLSLGDDAVPGIWIRDEEGDIFVTLYTSIAEEDDDRVTIMSLSMPGDGIISEEVFEDDIERAQYIRWAFPARNISSKEDFLELLKLYRNGNFLRVLPDKSITESNLEIEDLFLEENEDSSINPEGFKFNPKAYSAYVRLNALANILLDEEESITGIYMGDLPYMQLAYDGMVLTLSYELMDEQNEEFLLHIRTDIPTYAISDELGETPDEICHKYNFINACTRAYYDVEELPISGENSDEDEYITIHSCFPEKGVPLSVEQLSEVISIFVGEIERVLE